jgi:hypothetical protein
MPDKGPVSPQNLPTAERIMKRQRLSLDATLLREQFDAFRKKFGRDPKADDPIFFDPESDEPSPMPDSVMAEAFSELEAALDEIGAPPAVIYAFRKTKRLMTEENQRYLSAPEREEWDAAIRDPGPVLEVTRLIPASLARCFAGDANFA